MSQPKSNEELIEELYNKNPYRYRKMPNGDDGLDNVRAILAQKDAELQKAREKRKGWKGYVAVDPKADNYKYSPVFSDRKGAELWVKGKEISGLEVVEVDIFLVDHSELDQNKK